MNLCLIGGGKKTPILKEVTKELESPDVLLVPSSSSTEKSHNKNVTRLQDSFSKLGLNTVLLHDFGEVPTLAEKDEKFGKCGSLFIAAGNSPTMMQNFNSHGTRDYIEAAVAEGKLLMGTSAGALVVFQEAIINPSPNPENEDWDFEIMSMLGILRTIATAHADRIDPTKSITRLQALKQMLPDYYSSGLGLDNSSALVIEGAQIRVARSVPSANVHLVERDAEHKAQSRVIEPNDDLTRIIAVITK